MNQQEIKEFIDGHHWRFAKTMPKSPHWYTLRKNAKSNECFDRFVLAIRDQGEERLFYGKPYIYLRVGRHEYWTMGAPVEETILINRAEVKDD